MGISFGGRIKHGQGALQGAGSRAGSAGGFPLKAVLLAVVVEIVSGCQPASPPAAAPPSGAQLAIGSGVYESVCAQCHGDGLGDPMNPPLFGSSVLAGPPLETIRVVLRGQSGKSVVNGKLLQGIMPAQASLSDAEIAGVVAYVRATYANQFSAVEPEAVAKARLDGQ